MHERWIAMALPYAMEPIGEQITVWLHGELDLSTMDGLTTVLDESITGPECVNIVVDLNEVTFIDAQTIGALVRAYKKAAEAERALWIVGATGLVHRVLGVTGVLDLFTGRSRPGRGQQHGAA
jgi:anti-sigma B factor antagonist